MTVAGSIRRQREFDVVMAVVAGLVTWPIWLAAALAVKLSSPGPVLHRAERVGRDGTLFVLYKFRSMEVGAQAAGPGVTAAGDRRITTVGRYLRRSKIDELPQVLNVLRGDMSLVGPRPEDARYVDRYDSRQREILRWRPGITSPASIQFRDEESVLAALGGNLDDAYVVLMAQKIDLDLRYMGTRTLWGDLGVLGRTAIAVVR